MHIEFLVEELSAEVALKSIVPKILFENVTYHFHSHQGKRDLLGSLKSRLKAYKKWIPEDWKIVVLIDEDRQDCRELKQKLEEIAIEAGFISKTAAEFNQRFQLISRIAIEELEAWYFGDIGAIVKAYPRVSSNLSNRSRFRDPDAIKGGTWEALQRILQRAGYYKGGLAKIAAARDISVHMDPGRNSSKSFQVFRDGLSALAG
ncbi:MAG: DUF4276 family protein [Pseudomonadota bacterium]